MFHFSLALLVISPFLFFVRDKTFLCWSRFALIWLVVSVMLILLTPEYYRGGFLNLNPTKEQVSMWLAQFFVPASILLLAWKSRKTKEGA
jgi:hypothetical protein